jgi:hypothetical protein
LFDDCSGCGHSLDGSGRELDGFGLAGDGGNVGDGDAGAVEVDSHDV